MPESNKPEFVVGVVGPCGAGKSTLIAGLSRYALQARHIAQEHSYVPHMWQRIVNPDLLIYLDASFPVCTRRRKLNWTEADYLEQLRRLEHARSHADLVIETDHVNVEGVLQKALAFLKDKGAARLEAG